MSRTAPPAPTALVRTAVPFGAPESADCNRRRFWRPVLRRGALDDSLVVPPDRNASEAAKIELSPGSETPMGAARRAAAHSRKSVDLREWQKTLEIMERRWVG